MKGEILTAPMIKREGKIVKGKNIITNCIGAMLTVGIFTGLVSLSQAQEFSAYINREKNQIQLKTQGNEYYFNLEKEPWLMLRIKDLPGAMLFCVSEQAGAMDGMKVEELKEATIVKDSTEEKEVKAVYSLVFDTKVPPENTTRAQSELLGNPTKINQQIEMTLKIKKGLPCLFLTYKVVNLGDPFICYPVCWVGGGEYYCLPGSSGIEKKEFCKTYINIGAGLYPWVYVCKKENKGLCMIMDKKLMISDGGGSIYTTLIPVRRKMLQKGESVSMEMIVMPAENPEEMDRLYRKLFLH